MPEKSIEQLIKDLEQARRDLIQLLTEVEATRTTISALALQLYNQTRNDLIDPDHANGEGSKA